MNDQTIVNTTGEPINEAPVVDNPHAPALPAGYLENGYYATAEDGTKYLRPDFLGAYAQKIAAELAPLSAADFRGAFLRNAKKCLRRGTPYEAQRTCAVSMLPQAIKLIAMHKSPSILLDFITVATAAITDSNTFQAFYQHADAIYSYMLLNKTQVGG